MKTLPAALALALNEDEYLVVRKDEHSGGAANILGGSGNLTILGKARTDHAGDAPDQ